MGSSGSVLGSRNNASNRSGTRNRSSRLTSHFNERRRLARHAQLRQTVSEQVWVPISQILQNRRQRIGRRRRRAILLQNFSSNQGGGAISAGFGGGHHNVTCSQCNQNVTRQTRHRCRVCPQFELCEGCFSSRAEFHDESHAFDRVQPLTASRGRVNVDLSIGYHRPLPSAGSPSEYSSRHLSRFASNPEQSGGSVRYQCHYCNIFFIRHHTETSSDALQCPRCSTGFVELVNTITVESLARVDLMLQEIQMLQRAFHFAESLGGRSVGTEVLRAGLGLSHNHGPQPASRSALKALKEFELKQSHIRAHPSCVICMDAWEPGDLAVRLPCSHLYHKPCVVQWLKSNNSCPVCRGKLLKITKSATDGGEAETSSGQTLTPLQALTDTLENSESTSSQAESNSDANASDAPSATTDQQQDVDAATDASDTSTDWEDADEFREDADEFPTPHEWVVTEGTFV